MTRRVQTMRFKDAMILHPVAKLQHPQQDDNWQHIFQKELDTKYKFKFAMPNTLSTLNKRKCFSEC